MSGDDATPTQRLGSPTVTGPAAVARRALSPVIVALIVVGGLVIVAVVVVVVLLLSGRGDHVNASVPTPTATGSPSPVPTLSGEPPQGPGPDAPSDPQNAYFTVFDPDGPIIECFQDTPQPIGVKWDSKNAVSAQFLYEPADDDATPQLYDIPVRGDALPDGLDYPCTDDPMKFTLILKGEDGVLVSESWTVENVGYVYPIL